MKITINNNITINDNIIIYKSIINDTKNINISFINKSNIYYHYLNTYTKILCICEKVVSSSIDGYYCYKIKFSNTLPYFNLSFIVINKGISTRYKYILLYMSNIYNIFFYTYFIHKKYFIKINDTIYVNMFNPSSSHKKLFNCRDYYRIHSYI